MAFKMKGAPYPSNRKGAVNKEPQGNVNGRAKSSAFQKVDEKAYVAAYDKVVKSITADMTDEQLRKMIVDHNAKMRDTGGMKHRIAFNHAKSLRNEELRIKNKQNQ